MGSNLHNRRVAIYARHSTAVQDGSVEGQLDRCRRWVAQQGGRVVAEFADRAKSAATIIGRDGLEQLLVAIESGAVDVLVCEDLSRLSRSQGEVALLYAQFTFHGVELHSVAEGPVTPLHIGLKGTMNALLLQDIIDKTHRGLTAVARSGRSVGRAIYGYEIVRRFDDAGQVVRGLRRIDREEVRVVARIYETFLADASITEVARRLNADGIASPMGRTWDRYHRAIADRAATALERAPGTMERRPMDEAAVDLVRGAVSRFVVGDAGADRTGLKVVPELDPEAVYLLGTDGKVPRRRQ